MATRPNHPEPTVYYRERLTPSLVAVIAVFLVVVAFFIGPGQLYSVVIRGREPNWLAFLQWGAAFGVFMAVFITVYNYRTVLVMTDQVIRVLDRTISLERITDWTLVEGRELRAWRRRLLGDQGGSHGVGIGIWMLRGGRNKVFAPPWMPAGILLQGLSEQVLVGTRHPRRFLAALQAALGQASAQAVRARDGRDVPGPGTPPGFRQQGRRVVGEPMAQPPTAEDAHGWREPWPR